MPGVLPAQGSFNETFESALDLSAHGYVLMQVLEHCTRVIPNRRYNGSIRQFNGQTAFKSIVNISHIEYVALTAGEFTIDVVRPVCGAGFSWCALTRKCSTTCHGVMLENKTSIFAENTCNNVAMEPFCSQEETCWSKLKCPAFKEGAQLYLRTTGNSYYEICLFLNREPD